MTGQPTEVSNGSVLSIPGTYRFSDGAVVEYGVAQACTPENYPAQFGPDGVYFTIPIKSTNAAQGGYVMYDFATGPTDMSSPAKCQIVRSHDSTLHEEEMSLAPPNVSFAAAALVGCEPGSSGSFEIPLTHSTWAVNNGQPTQTGSVAYTLSGSVT